MIRYKEVEEEAAAMAVVEVVVMEVVVVVAEVDTESDFKDLLKPTRLTSARRSLFATSYIHSYK